MNKEIEPITIKKMPNKRTLEIFIEGMSDKSMTNKEHVIFDTSKGEFIKTHD